jgi:hypothetical protein
MILASGEFDMLMTFIFSSLDDNRGSIKNENSKKVIDQIVERCWWLCPTRELIFYHGSAFGAHRMHENGNWDGNLEFQRFETPERAFRRKMP